MCGGTLEINENQTIATCEYCGSQQTLPRLDDNRRANLYDRANHFRRNNEFDKAMGIYEQILNEDGTDAEAYWSLVLCSYGIEYVEDPGTHKRVPTVNRAQFTSIFDDDNYKSALKFSDIYQRKIYEEEAKRINEIQRTILAVAQKEKPFDVFICYKENDNNGRRTPDSVLANDLYHQLTEEGFKVFFSRITLEDKLGVAYEPYIFAALNSSKIMVVLGTKPEYFNAVWVKNEWSRYLSLIKQGQKKVLIPAYKDMDPYDLPEEFSHLQAQDMSKLGFMQDLIRGIKKISQSETSKTIPVKETVFTGENANIVPLLKRASIFLQDCAWDKAESYCEKILDVDPENPEAYIYLLLAHLKKSTQEDLVDAKEPIDSIDYYKKAMRFACDDLKGELINLNKENYYRRAVSAFNAAKTESEYKFSKAIFDYVIDYKDAKKYAEWCVEKAEAARVEAIYQEGYHEYRKDTLAGYAAAVSTLNRIKGYKDSTGLIEKSNLRMKEITVNQNATIKRATIVAICSVVAIILFSLWASARTKANNERAERIMANFPGKAMEQTEYDSLGYRYGYIFYENGECTETECVKKEDGTIGYGHRGGGVFSADYEHEYSVHISLTGKVTIQIGSSSYPLTVNNDDEPVSFKKGDDLYSIDSGFFNNDEPPVNNDDEPVYNEDAPVNFGSD